jgi:hypothetical protein
MSNITRALSKGYIAHDEVGLEHTKGHGALANIGEYVVIVCDRRLLSTMLTLLTIRSVSTA